MWTIDGRVGWGVVCGAWVREYRRPQMKVSVRVVVWVSCVCHVWVVREVPQEKRENTKFPPFLARPWAGDTLRDHIGWGGQERWKGARTIEGKDALTPSKLPIT